MWGTVVNAFILVAPVVGYAFQYKKIMTEKRDTFSTLVSLVVLISQVLRILFFWLSPYDNVFFAHSILMIVTQLALLELITRVRREQRMLPSTLFHTFSFRWKQFRRYFWQWDDFLSYVYFLVSFAVVSFCFSYVASMVPLYTDLLGFVSLLLESFLAVPQLLRNHSEGVDGLSPVLVGAWTIGDMTKVMYFFMSPLPMQFLLCSLLQAGVDVFIVVQMIMFRRSRRFKAHEY